MLAAQIAAEDEDIKRRAAEGDEYAKWVQSIPSASLANRARWQMRRQAYWRLAWCCECGRDLDPGEPIWHDWTRGPCGECCARFYRDWTIQQCEACGRTVHYWKGIHGGRYITRPACSEQHLLQAIAHWRRRLREGRRSGRLCELCDRPFTPPRSDGRYCSPACRQRAYRQRQREEQ
jgi:hypothetical protein